MTQSVNPFLLSNTQGVDIHQPDPSSWVFDVAKNGNLEAYFLQFDSDISVQVNLNGADASCNICCGYLVNKNNKINIDIKVLHNSKKTRSKQQIKGLARDLANVNFKGEIIIPHDSQESDGMQSHRGILLSNKATISATPQLEIWADDVKCAHGSAVGPLPDDQIFYLGTRGIDEASARKMLLSSFFDGIMPSNFDEKIQQWMDENV